MNKKKAVKSTKAAAGVVKAPKKLRAGLNAPLPDRELSWLSFNARVLQEAEDPEVPLLERVKFLGIFSNNLDEFFRVRVAGIRRLLQLKKNHASAEFKQLKKELEKIKATVLDQQIRFDHIYRDLILPALAAEQIFLVNEQQLTAPELKHVQHLFMSEVAGRVNPLMLQPGKDLPHLKDGAIYLAVKMQNSVSMETRYALVPVPTKTAGRFHILPGDHAATRIMLLDDILRVGLPSLFSSLDFDIFSAHTVKITRDAELDIDNEVALPLLEKVEKSLKQRKAGAPTRFIYDQDIPPDLLEFLTKKLKIDKDGAIPGGRYHNFRDFMSFPKVGGSHLRYKGHVPRRIAELDKAKSMLNLIQKHDLLLSYPYQSFEYVIRLLREAAIDPTVFAIRISLYRLAENSSIAEALINAVHNGKQVVVVMELRARFMEEHNIFWANRLKEEGAHVIYGIPNFKVHSKLIVISRRKGYETSHIVHIGTGNFNEDTARVYADHALLTARKRIAAECLRVFDMIQNFRPEKFDFKTLWVSPVNTRIRFIEKLAREIKHARKGKKARIIVKVNSLVDEVSIRALIHAARAGVKVDIIVRGICCLPTTPADTNIRIISIIDKYLEHARVFYFANDGDPEVYIGSADLMQRNLQYRVEVTTPVADREIRNKLIQMLEQQLSDNVKARHMESGSENKRIAPDKEKPFRSQEELYKLF